MPEPIVVLQPSLHSLEEYAELILDEAASLGIRVAKLRRELALSSDEDFACEIVDDIISEAIDRLTDAGFYVVEDEDTFLIYDRGDAPGEDENA